MEANISTDIERAKQEIIDAKKRAQDIVSDSLGKIVKQACKDIEDQLGIVCHGFGWVQYAPYFNDGDPCVFHVQAYAFLTDSAAEEFYDIDDDYKDSPVMDIAKDNPYGLIMEADFSKGQRAILDAELDSVKALKSIMGMEDILQSIFGDDSVVVIDKEAQATVMDISGEHD